MASKSHLHLLLLKVIVLQNFFTLYSCMDIPRNTLSLFPEVPTSKSWTDKTPEASSSVLESITDVNVEANKQPTQFFTVSEDGVNEEKSPPLTVLGLNIESEQISPYHPATSACSANSKMQMKEDLGPSYVEVVNFLTPSKRDLIASSMKMIFQIIKIFGIFSNPEQTSQARHFWTLEKILPFLYFTQFQNPSSEVWDRCIMITSLVFYAYHEKYIFTGHDIDYNLFAEFLRWYTENLYYILHPSFQGLVTQEQSEGGKMEDGFNLDPLAVCFLIVHDDFFYQKKFSQLVWKKRYPMAQKLVSKFLEDKSKWIHNGINSQLFMRSNPWEEWIKRSDKIMQGFGQDLLGKDIQKQIIGLANEQMTNQVATEFNDLWNKWTPDFKDYISYQISITNGNLFQFGHELTYFLKDQCKDLREKIVESNILKFSTSVSLFLQIKALPKNHELHELFSTRYSKYKSIRKCDAVCRIRRKARDAEEQRKKQIRI
ncbi:uncharacterized protein MELLADRAFT_60297 [Melampsora larici-populina 98AG31]|uniref:Secreted protein n=1 Tax=Melampsora larici-populina (strain 98AG31 / pathotype 3-4-7) TaxID=747676 RepID=F4RAT8_MELLP|nr:uncharacterized protein MELLADRAFT_60297 [Melampsora larici-populina 98AG31]EGG10720.1 hypothetical protein MELLADRAFT_60297 [Melampsora larici-populina 98AG31]